MLDMTFGVNIGLYSYSAFVLGFLFFAEIRQSAEKIEHPRRRELFLSYVVLTFVVLTADLISRLDGRGPATFTLCRVANFILFATNPLMSLYWFMYVCEQIDVEPRLRRINMAVQGGLVGLNALMVMVTQFSGLIYYFDAHFVYHRGPLFFVTSGCMLLMMVMTEATLLHYRHKFEQRHIWALIIFPLFPTAAIVTQMMVYGVALGLNCTVYSLMVLFHYMQNRSIDIDYLTGLYNRRKLDICMQQKIEAAGEGKPFGAILLDVDNFKSINDTLGHNIGDAALISVAGLLKGCLRADTFVARYGGDEFCIIIDIDDEATLHKIMDRIDTMSGEFNRRAGGPYKLSFSMGGAIYQPGCLISMSAFQKRIDSLMYQAKQTHAGKDAAISPMPRRRAEDKKR